MTNIQLAKKVLENIKDKSFSLGVYSTTGGKCCDSWGDYLDLYLSREQLLYLINKYNGYDELFEGLSLKEVDVDSIIYNMSLEAAWPDGGPSATVNDVIPDELSELSNELESLDTTDVEAIESIRNKLLQVTDSRYTFHFTVEANDYYFTEDAEEGIDLSAKEALGLLYGKHNKKEVFDGICKKSYDKNLINSKAEELGFANNYDNLIYGVNNECLEAYLNAMEYILDAIMSGEITDENLGTWLEYFDDSNNYEYNIIDWYKDREDYEDE
ncbi:MAG: hypothetical protein ACI31A_01455 [Candidatus Limisoma sp.]